MDIFRTFRIDCLAKREYVIFLEGKEPVMPADDDMIEKRRSQHGTEFLHPVRRLNVVRRRRKCPADMVVSEQDGICVC